MLVFVSAEWKVLGAGTGGRVGKGTLVLWNPLTALLYMLPRVAGECLLPRWLRCGISSFAPSQEVPPPPFTLFCLLPFPFSLLSPSLSPSPLFSVALAPPHPPYKPQFRSIPPPFPPFLSLPAFAFASASSPTRKSAHGANKETAAAGSRAYTGIFFPRLPGR